MDAVPLAVVLGANVRRLRTAAGITQGAVARHARDYGLKWTTASVADFEAGRSAPTFATVLAVVAALDAALLQGTQRVPVRLADLVAHDGLVALTADFIAESDDLAAVCAGQPWEPLGGFTVDHGGVGWMAEQQSLAPGLFGEYGLRVHTVNRLRKRSGLDEYRLARRLGTDADRLIAESGRLWGRTFSEQRDLLAGPGANAQKRGQVARQLGAELRKALDDGND